jgi:hypothetical protein
MWVILAAACLGDGLEANPPAKKGTVRPEGDVLHGEASSRVRVIQKGDGRLVFHPGGRLAAPAPDWAARESLLREVKPGANLAGRDLSFLDLSGKSLAKADLTGANLTGADLRGTSFAGANLSRARLFQVKVNARTSLAGAQLFMTRIHDSPGLSLGQGQFHPFFAQEAGTGVSIRQYSLPDPSFHPDEILVGPKGDLRLMARGKPMILGISPTGAILETVLSSGSGAQAMALDRKGELWAVLGRTFLHMPASVADMSEKATVMLPLPFGTEVLGAAVSAHGTLWLSMPGELCSFSWTRTDQDMKATPCQFDGMNLRSLAVVPDGREVYGIDAERGLVLLFRRGSTVFHSIGLPPKSSP